MPNLSSVVATEVVNTTTPDAINDIERLAPWQLSVVNEQNDIDGLVQERRNSTANAVELLLSCTNPSTWKYDQGTLLVSYTENCLLCCDG